MAYGAFFLLLLVAFRRNVKIFEEEKEKFKLVGKARISRRHLVINVDKFLDNESYLHRIKISLNKKISRKLDGEEISVKYKDEYLRYIVKYDYEKFEIIINNQENNN